MPIPHRQLRLTESKMLSRLPGPQQDLYKLCLSSHEMHSKMLLDLILGGKEKDHQNECIIHILLEGFPERHCTQSQSTMYLPNRLKTAK